MQITVEDDRWYVYRRLVVFLVFDVFSGNLRKIAWREMGVGCSFSVSFALFQTAQQMENNIPSIVVITTFR